MKTKFIKTIILSVGLSLMATRAFAVNDPVNSLLNLMRQIQSSIEVSYNKSTKAKIQEINKIFGKKGKINPVFADSSFLGIAGQSQQPLVDYKDFAPTVTNDIQSILKRGFKAIPNMYAYAEEQFKVLNSSDVNKQAEVLVQINERLNISAMDAIQRAKNISAATNNEIKNAEKQLKLSGSAPDLHHKFVQEAAQDIEAFKRDVSLNQIAAQFLETQASNMMAARQHSTADIDNFFDELDNAISSFGGGSSGGRGSGGTAKKGTKPLKYSAATGFPESWGRVSVVPCGTMNNVHNLRDQVVAQFENDTSDADLRGAVSSIINENKQKMDTVIAQMVDPANLSETDTSDVVSRVQRVYDSVMSTGNDMIFDATNEANLTIENIYSETVEKLYEIAQTSAGGHVFFANAAKEVIAAAQAKIDAIIAASADSMNTVSKNIANALDGVARNGVSVATGGQSNSSNDVPRELRNNLNSMHSAAGRDLSGSISDAKKDVSNYGSAVKADMNKLIDEMKKMVLKGEL